MGLYDKRIHPRTLKRGNPVLRSLTQNTKVPSDYFFGANCEGLYSIDKPVGASTSHGWKNHEAPLECCNIEKILLGKG